MNPTPEQLAAQVAAMVKNRPDARVVGVRVASGWTGGDSIVVDGSHWPVAVCLSPLEMSERLSAVRDGEGLVILTPLSEQALSLDVLARMAGRRLVHIDRWEMVREAFGASQIDPRLPMQGWVADALLAAKPPGGFAPVTSGWLDADSVWKTLLVECLGLSTGRPDAADLVRWSVDAERVSRYAALVDPLRSGLRDRLAESAGGLGEIFCAVIEAGKGSSLLPIGLVCEILFVAGGRRTSTLDQAIARLEPSVGGLTLNAVQGRAWFVAARSVLDGLPAEQRRIWIERAEGLLADLKATPLARSSTVLSSGFEERLAVFGKALMGSLAGEAELKEVEAALGAVAGHADSAFNQERMERLEMALKLARRLESSSPPSPSTIGAAVESHLRDGVFVDWARRYLLGGDSSKTVANAFGRLYQRMRDLREPQNQIFAEHLRVWNRRPKSEQGVLPIEQFLDKVVAVVAAKAPVLVVVIDGMDGGIFEELAEDLRHGGWARWADPTGVGSGSLLGALPTVTEFSRTALLTGRLAAGSSGTEKPGFARHPALLSVSRPSSPPALFHKGELTDAAAKGLSSVVRESINAPEQRVVGVVINAVDDHLAKSDQLRLKWTVDSFRVLDALLYEARVAGRIVILTADHGHVLEEDGRRLTGGAEERWRTSGEPLGDQEILFEGPRIQAATGMERVVLLWSEATRYSQKRNGYHGGATLQEVVVPLGVFLSVGQELDGWHPMAESVPEWWIHSEPARAEATPPKKRGGKKASAEPQRQASLFEVLEREADPSESVWIQGLVDSEVFAAQTRLAGRLAPTSERVREVLDTLDNRHGRAPKRILAQTIQVPEFRLRGILVSLQRLLNVDGYQVLSVEEETETVLLDIELLKKQFQLGD